jgi:hypothetical protein
VNITRQLVREWDLGWAPEALDLLPDDGLTPLQVLDLDIDQYDRQMAVMHAMPDRDGRLLAIRWAIGARDLAASVDPRSRHATDVAAAFAYGQATAQEMAEAGKAAECVAALALNAMPKAFSEAPHEFWLSAWETYYAAKLAVEVCGDRWWLVRDPKDPSGDGQVADMRRKLLKLQANARADAASA